MISDKTKRRNGAHYILCICKWYERGIYCVDVDADSFNNEAKSIQLKLNYVDYKTQSTLLTLHIVAFKVYCLNGYVDYIIYTDNSQEW